MESQQKKQGNLRTIVAISWLVVWGSVLTLQAEPVDVEQAKAVAFAQLKKITGGDVMLRSDTPLDLVYQPKSETDQPYFYVFNGEKGFVIVSGDDRAIPVLGYSDDGTFDPNNIPPNMAEFLKRYQNEIDYVVKNDIKSSSALLKKWKSTDYNDKIQIRSYTSGTNLIQSGWGQGAPFYNYCPIDSSGPSPERTVVGCVGTAMAQVIRYWGADKGIAPTHGFNGAVFENAYYDYANMPVAINANFPQEQQDAVALLSYHCGLAANTNYYAASGSEATMLNAAKGLRENFGYSDAVCVGAGTAMSISFTELKNILRAEIDKEQPVLYAGGNHAFICDGYNSSDQFHMNWGWSSHADGWYQLTALNPDDNDYSYYLGATIVYNIYPVRDVNISNVNRPVIYVTPEGAGTMDGSSWGNARPDLHNAIQENQGEPNQIWVKKGTYYGNTAASSNSAAFVISSNNRVYGGFEGNESSLEERQLLNPSILDGQQTRRVLGQTADFDLSETSLWDGFTIRNGLNNQKGTSNINPNADPMISGNDMTGNGGGVYLKKNGILRNCTIENCTAISGGGVFNNGGEVIDCSFYNNQAENAGALYNSSEGTIQLSNSIIEQNISTMTYGYGGGIFNSGQLYIYDGTEIRNNHSLRGGGLYNNGTVTLMSGSISYNTATQGAGIYSEETVYMSGGIISHNKALTSGGGIFASKKSNSSSNAMHRFTGGNILNNTSDGDGGGITVDNGFTYIMDSVKIQGNYASGRGGGIYSEGGKVFDNGYLFLISGTIGTNTSTAPNSIEEAIQSGGNYAYAGGGVFSSGYLQYNHYDGDTTTIVIGGNYANNGGGIYINSLMERAEFRKNVVIRGNTAAGKGGGMYCIKEFHMNGCNITDNKAVKGGGFYFENTVVNRRMYISSGLIATNSAQEGGGVYNEGEGSAYQTFYMSGGEISGNNAQKGSGIFNYGSGQYAVSDSAKIKDVVYLQRYTNFGDTDNCYLLPYNLTYHVNNLHPIPIEVSYPSGASIIASYNTADEAVEAVNNKIYAVSNYGWRPVASGSYVKLEQYTPPVIAKDVVYVTPEGAGKKDGSSWEDATPNLYGEMMKDRTDTLQIWVKEGLYYGNTSVGQGADKAAFILGKRNKVYGGFTGNESILSARTQSKPSVLDGQHARRVICQLTDFASADSSFIDGFTIRNGADTLAGSANIILQGTTPYQSGTDMAGNGGGAYLRANGILKSCIIENCKAVSGGGVFNYGGKVMDCSFINNTAGHAAGLFNRNIASLANCTLSGNRTKESWVCYGGGIFNIGMLHIQENATIEYNHSGYGGGLYNTGTVLMYGGSIAHNTCSDLGGGIYNDGVITDNGQITIYDGDISYNDRSGIVTHGMLTLYGGTISNNVGSVGGGINCSNGTLNILGSSVNITQNTARSGGGGIYLSGGTVATISAGTIGVMTNEAPESAEEALAIGGNVSSASGYGNNIGGGIYSLGNLSFVDTGAGDLVIGGNYANESGGGLYHASPYTVTINLPSNVLIYGNTANAGGGGIYSLRSDAVVNLNGCSISYNKARFGGGGIGNSSGSLYVHEGTVISNNRADANGGGISNSGYLYITGGLLSGNESVNGGAIYSTYERLTITAGEISGNHADLGDGIYSTCRNFTLQGAVKMKDIIYIPSSSYAVNLGIFSYHTDSSKPITIQGNTGYYVATGSYSKSYVDQGILISTPGFYPVVQSDSRVYLYSNGTKSAERLSATMIDPIHSEKISAYPSLLTSGGMLTIDSPDGGAASVWNMSGMMVGRHKLSDGKTQVSVSYPAGNYVVKVKTGTGKEKDIKIIVK